MEWRARFIQNNHHMKNRSAKNDLNSPLLTISKEKLSGFMCYPKLDSDRQKNNNFEMDIVADQENKSGFVHIDDVGF